jgi:hypothetical protein
MKSKRLLSNKITIKAIMTTNEVLKDLPSTQKAAQYDPKDNAAHVREVTMRHEAVDKVLKVGGETKGFKMDDMVSYLCSA